MSGGRTGLLLAETHTSVPSEAVSSGLAMWWALVALTGMLAVASAGGFVFYLRRTSPARSFAAPDASDESAPNSASLKESP